jgi:hypothetical protein
MAFTTVKTTMVQAYPGMKNGLNKNRVTPGRNEAATEIPFGLAVKQGATDGGILIPDAQANVMIGVLEQSHALAKDPGTGVAELGDTGLKQNAVGDVAEEGELWVLTDEAVTPTSAVRFRTSGAQAGYFRASAVGGSTVDVSDRARWAGTYGSGFALLKFDFRAKKAGAAD